MDIPVHRFKKGIKIWNLGDIHRGNKTCNAAFLRKAVKEIAKDKHSYWISTGDMLEAAIRHSVSEVHGTMDIDQELDRLKEELAPITHKCLGFVESNHHERVKKHTGASLDRMVANELKIPFLGISGVINIICGRCAYFIVLHHGVGGGTSGNKINRALQLASIHPGADVYMTGHTHAYGHVPFTQRVIDKKRNLVTELTSHIVVTGHCVKWSKSYAERMGLKPLPNGFSVVELSANNSGHSNNKKVEPSFFSN